jgi:class 3 adenylate cyclase
MKHNVLIIPLEAVPMKEDIEKQSLVDNSYSNIESKLLNALDDIISFSGTQQYFAVGFVDIVNSTNITAKLSFETASLYYSTFLNSMSVIVKASGGGVVKNIGDGLLFYFQENPNSPNNRILINMLECGLNMIKAHDVINERLLYFDLPDLNYRVSADYGSILVADSKTSFNIDLFGSPVNTCYKINNLAFPNTMVVGQNFYQNGQSINGYDLQKINTCILLAKERYEVYEVKRMTS